MSEQNAEVLDFLRAQFARMDNHFDKVERQLKEHADRLANIETVLVAIRRDNADVFGQVITLGHRLDGMSDRLDRIERRLDLVGAP